MPGVPHPRAYGSTARVLGRYVRERGIALARDGRRQADLGPGRTARPARPRGRPRGRLRRPRRLRSGDGRRRGDVHGPGPLPDRDRARHRQRPSRRSSTAPRPASGPAACCGARDRPAGGRGRHAATEPSPRRRPSPGSPAGRSPTRCAGPRGRADLRVVIHPERGVVVTSRRPAGAAGRPRAPHRLVPGASASRGCAATSPAQARDRAELAARGGLRDGATLRFRGDLHRLRIVPARPGAAPLVGRTGRRHRRGRDRRPRRPGRPALDRRPSSRPGSSRGPATAIEREIAPPRRGARRHPGRGQRSATSGRAGGAPRARAGWRSRGGSSSPRPRRSRRSSSTSWPTCGSSATARAFWAVVASRRPDHKVWRRWLHDHATELHGALDDGRLSDR